MNSSKCCCLLVVIPLFFGVAWSQAEPCYTARRERGVCVNIRRCPPLISLLTISPRPLPQSVRQQLLENQCGFEGKDPKVCCVSNSVTSETRTTETNTVVTTPRSSLYREEPPSVAGHRNLGLLRSDCGLSDADRLLGGNKTGVLEFPWMALIAYNTARGLRFQCGGTIINEKYILTAAHCITNLDGVTLAGVRVGEHDISTEEDCIGSSAARVCYTPQDFTIEETIPHPKYIGIAKGNNPRLQHDIGLIRLSGSISMDEDNILTVCLPTTRELQEVNMENRNVTIIGWGATETGTSSPDLLKINIPVVPTLQCAQILNGSLQDGVGFRQVCAGGVRGIDSCGGDSGGPMHLYGELNGLNRLVQQGIVSFGPRRCGQMSVPGVYTRVAYYMDWILDQLRV